MTFNEFELSIRHSLYIGLILLTFCAVFAFFFYHHLNNRFIKNANEYALIVIPQITADINGTVRPSMLLDEDRSKGMKSGREGIRCYN